METISEPRRKTQLLSELNELFSNAEIVVVSHYKGLTVQEVSELRNNIRKAGAGFRVTKNRITRLALKGTKFEAIADLFKGPTAIAFANDPISACKACVEFAKNNEKLIVVGGAMGTGVLSTAEINKLATIRLWTSSEPRLSAFCRLLPLSWQELPRLTARKKLHKSCFYAGFACEFFDCVQSMYTLFKSYGALPGLKCKIAVL